MNFQIVLDVAFHRQTAGGYKGNVYETELCTGEKNKKNILRVRCA